MTVKLLSHILMGLPESCEIKFGKDGKLVDVCVVAVTRHNPLPDLASLPQTRAFHSIHESIILTDEETISRVKEGMEVKVVWRYMPGKEAI